MSSTSKNITFEWLFSEGLPPFPLNIIENQTIEHGSYAVAYGQTMLRGIACARATTTQLGTNSFIDAVQARIFHTNKC
jgi:hypothetical protein